MVAKQNPIKYLNDDGFKTTSNPAEYYKSYNPDRGKKPWGKRDLMAYGINADAYCGGWHRAFDMSKWHKAPIKSIANAIVLNGTGWNTFGWTLVLGFYDANGDHYQVIYGHLDRNPLNYLKVGQKVKKGQVVAYQGASNNINAKNMASHLHIQFQPFGALGAKAFTCNGINPLNINISKTHATRPPNTKKSGKKAKQKAVKIKKNKFVIALDIGHGKNSFPPSKGVFRNGKGYAEFDFNNALGKKTKKLLKHNGFTVIMAQPFDSNDVSLTRRTNYYDSKKPDLGLSQHANAGNSTVEGRCAFYWFTSKQGKSFADSIIDNMKAKGYSAHGVGLHASRWGEWTNLHMVRMSTTFPMVLVEHGFMTNNKDFKLIFGSDQQKYIEDMAHADVKAVCDYFNLSFYELDEFDAAAPPAAEGKALFRVQVGAFEEKSNAVNIKNKITDKDYDTYMAYDTEEDLYRIQVGAYSKKSNAEKQLKKLKDDGFKDAFIASNDGHIVTNETSRPNEKQTPYTIGEWKTNKYGTQYIAAKGTFTVGATRIMSREGSPFDSAPEGGWAYPNHSIEYDEMVRVKEGPRKGHVEIGYNQNGKRWYLPFNTWDPLTGNVGEEEWGSFS